MRQHILITGATKGIGRACAEAFAAAGWTVTGVARTGADVDAMVREWKQRFPTAKLHPVVADLATAGGVRRVPEKDYDVVLLNAAGFTPGRLLEGEDVFGKLLHLNVLGNHRLARRLLPTLRKKGKGHLVVIGSTGTDNWKGHMTAYVATKYALRGLFLGWQQDLHDSGVLATLVAPGATLTASWDNETPPPDIMAPEQVAKTVMDVVKKGIVGRIVVGRTLN